MDQSPNLGLPYILAAQAQKHVTHNEAILSLDTLVQLAVIDRDLVSPPAATANGDRYLIPATATGDWAAHAQSIAAYQNGAWAFLEPRPGWLCWVVDEQALLVWTGHAWSGVSASGSSTAAQVLGINATADPTNRLAVASPSALFTHEGAGHQLKINKAAISNTASLLYQTNFSGRAEMGLAGDDDFHFKVSQDGTSWKDAIRIDRGTGAVAMPFSTLAGPNILINGDFQINQRGFGGGALAAGAYGFDRWKTDTGGANVTLNGYVVTLASGALVQDIEPQMAGVSSFASLTVTISVEAPSADLTVSFGSQSGTIVQGAGRKAVTLAAAAGDSGSLPLKIANASAGSVTFGRVKLELGPVDTPWQARPLPLELALCQRYFQATCPYGRNPSTYAPGAGGGSIYTNADPNLGSVTVVRLPAPMRAIPSVLIRDGVATSGKVSGYNGAWLNNVGFTGVMGLSDKGFSLQQNNPGFFNISFDYTAEAEL